MSDTEGYSHTLNKRLLSPEKDYDDSTRHKRVQIKNFDEYRADREEWHSSDRRHDSGAALENRRAPPQQQTAAPSSYRNGRRNGNVLSVMDMSPAPNSLTVRCLVSMKDAGVIIGRGGKSIRETRESSSTRINVSDLIQGATERILSVTGEPDSVARVSLELSNISGYCEQSTQY